jgi:hypothetical protein
MILRDEMNPMPLSLVLGIYDLGQEGQGGASSYHNPSHVMSSDIRS